MVGVPKRLVHELDRKRLPSSVELEFLKLGRIAYDYLYGEVKERTLSDRQAVNALHLLFLLTREPCYGLQNHLLELALDLTSDMSVDIRTTATIIAIRLSLVSRIVSNLEIPLGQQDVVAPFVERAVQLGLKSQHEQSYAEDFLKGAI